MKTPEEIEKLADEKYLKKAEAINDSTIMGFIVSAVKGGFVEGYQQCQEDNKGVDKWTFSEILEACYPTLGRESDWAVIATRLKEQKVKKL
jgi:hypothetical protein